MSNSDIIDEFPVKFQIETFHGCNASCSMCSVNDWERPKGEMPDDVFKAVIDQAQPFLTTLQAVSLIMDGEALMGKKVAQRIRQGKDGGLPNIGFATNASLLTADKGTEILDAGIDWISFSFDSMTKNIYETERKNLVYETVFENIENFVRLRNKGGYKTKINIRFLDHNEGRAAFDRYKDYWTPRLTSRDEVHYGYLYDWYSGNDETADKSVDCPYVTQNIVILNDGAVPLCCKDYNATYVYGNILSTPLLDIWNSEKYRTARAYHQSGKGGAIPLCAGCEMPAYEGARELLPVKSEKETKL